MKKNYFLPLLFLFNTLVLFAAVNPAGFIANKGQWNDEVKFLFKSNGMNAWITNSGITYDFYKIKQTASSEDLLINKGIKAPSSYDVRGHVVRMDLTGSSANSSSQKLGLADSKLNYFLGNDESKWATDVETYAEVTLENVYNGVDLRYYVDNGELRYDFILSPQADPSQIKWQVNGVNSFLSDNGEIVFSTSVGDVYQSDLYVYQNINGIKKEVESAFEIQNGAIQFQLGDYDKQLELVIDPVTYSTYLGGSGADEFMEIIVTPQGEKWVYGETTSTNYPTSVGAYSNSNGGNRDLVISKINSTGNGIIFSTYVGGNANEFIYVAGNYAALASDGGLVFTATSESENFPSVIGAFDSQYNGGTRDAIVAKINSTGNSLIFSTYFGGPEEDWGQGVALDPAGNVYMVGYTTASGSSYPITGGAYDQTSNGGGDVAITKFNNNCSAVIFSTLFGGNAYDDIFGIKLDSQNNPIILGVTNSTDLPASGFQTSKSPGLDTYIAKLNSTGTSLISCTYLGGDGDDYGWGLDQTSNGSIVVSGNTDASNFPTINGNPFIGGGIDAYLVKLSSDLSTQEFGTLYGSSLNEFCYSVDVDIHDAIYISGETYSPGLFLVNPDFNQLLGESDLFIARFNPGGGILYASFYGGTAGERAKSMWCDDNGNVYVIGATSSIDFPVSNENVQDVFGEPGQDGFIVEFQTCATNFSNATVESPVCFGSLVNFEASGGQIYSWTGPNGFNSTSPTPSLTAGSQSGGTYFVSVTDYGCNSISQIDLQVTPELGTTIVGPTSVDVFTPTTFVAPQNIGSTYTWFVNNGTLISGQGTNNVSITFPSAGTATVTVTETNGDCSEASSSTVIVGTEPNSVSDVNILPGVKVFPNPSRGLFQVDIGANKLSSEAFIEVLDNTGRIVFKSNVNDTITNLDLQDLSAGSYLLRLSDQDKASLSRIFILD